MLFVYACLSQTKGKCKGDNFLSKHKNRSVPKFLILISKLISLFFLHKDHKVNDLTLSVYPTKIVFINKQLS